MNNNKMKPAINNPVSNNNNMWVSKMPYNFQAAKRVTLASGVDAVPISSCTHRNQVTHNTTPPNKWTKSTLTKYYAEQIHPQYPLLTKAKVRAALMLADNNLHECRILLDLKSKLLELKKPFNVPLVPECLRVEKSADQAPSPNNLETAPAKPQEKSSNTDAGSSNTISNVSSVYDFSDTDIDIQSPRDWFEERRANKLPVPSRKIGVLIVKCDDGYKALPLK